ncbi:15303_t:CDS:1, partial [Dentiscutata heterogama]
MSENIENIQDNNIYENTQDNTIYKNIQNNYIYKDTQDNNIIKNIYNTIFKNTQDYKEDIVDNISFEEEQEQTNDNVTYESENEKNIPDQNKDLTKSLLQTSIIKSST